jgi:hypothetical protein
MLRLHCAEILHALRHKPIFISTVPEGFPQIVGPKDKYRIALLNPLLSKIHQSQKFIFDSGMDVDEQTVMAVRETAVNMIEAKLFRQPYPVMWIEDPFETDPEKYRNLYLAIEKEDSIEIHFFSKSVVSGPEYPSNIPEIHYHPFPLVIDLTDPSDKFLVIGPDHISQRYSSVLGEAVYSFKKMLVTLNTENMIIDKIRADTELKSWGGNPRTRPYAHSVVRVPMDTDHQSTDGMYGSDGKPRRRHLVRGYIYGKHTRPLSEQRWIKPFWRGINEVSVNERSHYVVR